MTKTITTARFIARKGDVHGWIVYDKELKKTVGSYRYVPKWIK